MSEQFPTANSSERTREHQEVDGFLPLRILGGILALFLFVSALYNCLVGGPPLLAKVLPAPCAQSAERSGPCSLRSPPAPWSPPSPPPRRPPPSA